MDAIAYKKIGDALYVGKANSLYAVEGHDDLLIMEHRDDASAFNGERKGSITGKGRCNHDVSAVLMQVLEKNGVPTHFVQVYDECCNVIKKADPIKLEVIMRNIATGSLCKRLPFEDKTPLKEPIFELSLKDDSRGDPLINTCHAIALQVATKEDLIYIRQMTYKINRILREYFLNAKITLVDFKIEFGRLPNGQIVVMDEISPDTCRLWDIETGKKLDKDLFRQNLGGEEEAYRELSNRVVGLGVI